MQIIDLLHQHFKAKTRNYCDEFMAQNSEGETFYFLMDILGKECHILHFSKGGFQEVSFTNNTDLVEEYLKTNKLIK